MLKKYIIIFCLLFTFAQSVFAALTATVNRDQLGIDEFLTLTIESDDQLSGRPDWSVLANDFQVISTSQQTQLSIVNGKMSSHVSWTLTLLPRHGGSITIPSFQVGSVKTQPLVVTVNDLPVGASQNSTINNPPLHAKVPKSTTSVSTKDIFMEVNVTPKEAYVQQQINYTIKIYFKRKIDEAFLTGPIVPNATVAPLGEDIYYSTVRRGQFYRVLERTFIITPQQSGDFDITPSELSGVIEKEPGDIFDFGNFMTGGIRESVKISAPKKNIRVKAKPSQFNDRPWLPSKKVTIKENWKPDQAKIHVGDPITREITIQAIGVKGDAIPKIAIPPQNNLNIYSEPLVTKTETDSQDLRGSLKQKIVMVPTQPGVIKIPALDVPWWNTETNRMQVLHLRERRFNVLAAPASTNQNTSQLRESNNSSKMDNNSVEEKAIADVFSKWLPQLLTGLLGLLILTLLIIWWRKPRKPKTSTRSISPSHNRKTRNAKNYFAELNIACTQNDPQQTRRLLLEWARTHWPTARILGLLDVVRELKATAQSELLEQLILDLDRVIYTEQARTWQGDHFWQVFESWRKNHPQSRTNTGSKQEQTLPPLYLE